VRGEELDARSDLFSFGAVLYEMATGRQAFDANTSAVIFHAILAEEPEPATKSNPLLPKGFDEILHRALEKDREFRYQSASGILADLKRARRDLHLPSVARASQSPASARIASTQPSKTGKSSSGRYSGVIDSLAILPLENASGDTETEYLSDGIAETLINTLAQLRKIRIVPRAVAFRHRGPGLDPLAVGRELGTRAVLAGRMVQRGDDLIVSVELVDVERQAQLWGGRYNRKMADLIALQEELTTEISEKLRLQLTGEEKKKLRKRPTQNNEAFRLVLQARHYGGGMSGDGMRKAIALRQQAIEIDPGYALAYSGLSSNYLNLGVHGYAAPTEVYPRAMAAAKKALELDETLAEAHVTMAYCLMFQNWDLAGADRELQRSRELNPDLAMGFESLSAAQMIRGRFDDAIAKAKRAVELAPTDFYPNYLLGTAYLYRGQLDKAIEWLCKATEIDPGSPLGHSSLARAHAASGQREQAIGEFDIALALSRRSTVFLLRKAALHAILGETREARGILEEVEKKWKPDGTSSVWIAAAYASLGEKDSAFEWLEKAFQEHVAFLILLLKIPSYFGSLHGDPRFDDLVKRIGIPD